MADDSFDFGSSNGFGKSKYNWTEILSGKVHFELTPADAAGKKHAKHFDYQCRSNLKRLVGEGHLPKGSTVKVSPFKTVAGKKVKCNKDEREGFAVQVTKPAPAAPATPEKPAHNKGK